MMYSVVCVLALCTVISGTDFNIMNNCGFDIGVGIQGNPDNEHLSNGGFILPAGQSRVLNAPDNWRGRFWGRTGCDEGSGHCETGDCGNKIECAGAGGVPPVTLAEITLKGADGNDFYDVSLVDGFNLPVGMCPVDGTKTGAEDAKYDCTCAGCYSDINSICPPELAEKNGDTTIACKSACAAFDTDEYCCRGDHNTPETCKSSDWPQDYPKIFKDACPDAYSYAYDDKKSTFTCKNANYDITFCSGG